MSISERVKTAEAALIKTKDDLTTATKTLEDNPEEEGTLVLVEELTTLHDKQQKTVDALKRAETVLMARALPLGGGAPGAPGAIVAPGGLPSLPGPDDKGVFAPAIITRRQEPQKAGDIIFKHAVVAMLAHVHRKSPDEIIDTYFRDIQYVKATWDYMRMIGNGVQKTGVDPAMTTVATWAQELLRVDVRGFLTDMAPVSIAASLAAYSMNLTFDGFNSITIPRRSRVPATATEPAWVGEGGAIPLTRFTLSSATLNRYKLAAITTMTREIMERSTPSIQMVVTDALREAYGIVLDAALLSNTAMLANVRPAGLRVGAGSAAGAAGGGEDAVRSDIMAMMTRMSGANLGVKPVLIINNIDALAVSLMTSALSIAIFAAELAQGKLLGIPIIVSINCPQHLAILVDAAYFATAFDPPMFDVSDVATIVEANADATPPTHADDAAGALGTAGQVIVGGGIAVAGANAGGAAAAGYTARSLWQTYSLGVRMIAPSSWMSLHAGAVQVTTATTWSV